MLAACSASSPEPQEFAEEDRIDCALDGQLEFARECAVERSRADGDLILVVHHPGGGFRRFQIVDDGRGVIAADGADDAQVTVVPAGIRVVVADDSYILPARMAGGDEP
jgi:myo-inositol-hexaphosphate 3-phosphohydrolase